MAFMHFQRSFLSCTQDVTAFAIIYASAIGERAYEYTEKRQGYFTWAVVEGLKGNAANEKGEVTLTGLVKYLQEKVPRKVSVDLGVGKNQRPFASIEGYKAEELVISVISSKVISERRPWVRVTDGSLD